MTVDEERPQVKALVEVARRLDYMIGQVTPDEVAWQDANYDRDSALGRELLFLIANDGWIRSTSEIIDIARSDAIETTLDIDIDLSRITHEAFHDWSGQIWLPIVALPPLRQELPDPEPFSTLTVTDASGTDLMTLPRADVRHRLSAALTEIILNVVAARQSDIGGGAFVGSRDHRLVLSAAIYRLLREETVPAPLLDSGDPMRQALREPMTRIDRARHEIGSALTLFAGLLTEPDPPHRAGQAAARQLTERAILVLSAFTKSAIIVVPADRYQRPTVLTVRLPGRALHLAAATWADVFGPAATSHRRWTSSRGWRRQLRIGSWIFPSASLHLDMLLPSAGADRQVRVNLPDGISPDPSLRPARRADLDVRCEQPFPMRQLAAVTSQLLQSDMAWPAPLRQSLADLALAKADAVVATLRDHRLGAGPAEAPFGPDRATAETRVFRDKLASLRAALRGIAMQRDDGDAAREALTKHWADGGWLASPMQRRTSTDTISPGVVAARSRVIDDATQRSAITSARMEVQIAVTDSAYYSAARLSGWINALLMIVELGFFPLARWRGLLVGQDVSPEVLALILTLFSAIQLGRIERTDRSTIRGVLVPRGNPLIIAAIIPPVILAVSVAFSRSFTWVMTWTGICVVLQLSDQWLMWLVQHRELNLQSRRERSRGDTRPDADWLFYTDAPDYSHDAILHSIWWRRTTEEALMIGRPAHGYLIWQHDHQQALSSLLTSARPARKPGPSLPALWPRRPSHADRSQAPAPGNEPGEASDDMPKSLLEQPVNVLALQRSGTRMQSLNFVVFRDEPEVPLRNAVPIELDPSLLTLAEDATSVISVFLGIPADAEAKVAQHPVAVALHLAAAHGLVAYEVQLPVPAPDVSYAHLQWGRVQFTVRPEELGHIQVFMTSLLALTTTAVVGIQSRAGGIPRMLNPLAASTVASEPADRSREVLAADLDVVARSGVPSDGGAWRLMGICADWRAGIESQLLASLDSDLTLVGLTAAVLYGQSVLMLLCHGGRKQAGSDDPELHPHVFFDKWQSREDLGAAPADPLLRVHMRTPDRPGATVAVLESLQNAIRHVFPHAFRQDNWTVWYAKTAVRDGNMAHVKLTIVLPIDHDDESLTARDWGPGEFSRIERRTLELLAHKMADDQHYPEPGAAAAEMLPNTVIRLGLVKMRDLSVAQSQADQNSSLDIGSQPAHGGATSAQPPIPNASRSHRRLFRSLLSLAALGLAMTAAMLGVIISGTTFFLPPDPTIIIAAVSAAGGMLAGIGAVIQSMATRNSARRNKPAARKAVESSAQPSGGASAHEDLIRAERQTLACRAVVATSAELLSNYRIRSGQIKAMQIEVKQAERLTGKCYAEFWQATAEAELLGGRTSVRDAARKLRGCGESLFREPTAKESPAAVAFEAVLETFIDAAREQMSTAGSAARPVKAASDWHG